MQRRSFLASAISTILTASLPLSGAFAQTAKLAVDKPVTITFYNYNLASAGIGADATKKLIAEFMAANPDIKVEGVAVPPSDMASRLQSDIAANRIPDVAQVVFDGLSFVADNLGAVALEDAIPQKELSAHFDGMIPAGIKLGQLNGKTYALAYTFSTPVLFYNADLFRNAGLDPDQPPSHGKRSSIQPSPSRRKQAHRDSTVQSLAAAQPALTGHCKVSSSRLVELFCRRTARR